MPVSVLFMLSACICGHQTSHAVVMAKGSQYLPGCTPALPSHFTCSCSHDQQVRCSDIHTHSVKPLLSVSCHAWITGLWSWFTLSDGWHDSCPKVRPNHLYHKPLFLNQDISFPFCTSAICTYLCQCFAVVFAYQLRFKVTGIKKMLCPKKMDLRI